MASVIYCLFGNGETMRPEIMAALIDGCIPFFIGIYLSLLGFRVVGKQPGQSPKYDQWHNQFGTMLKVLGPLLILFGIFQIVQVMVR